MNGIDLLTDEIRRVITAPYAVCLKKLQDIVSNVDKAVLQRWADGHPCQIDALAEAVIDGLQLWAHVIEILGHFCHVVAFRDAVLRIRPSLLDTLLTKAVDSQHGYDEYFSPCTSMLGATLPEDAPLPASAAVFFLRVVGTAVQAASASTIRPIYSMLVGVGPGLLDVMPETEVMQLQDRLVRLLRNVDDQTANLLCLAIFARLFTRSNCPNPTAATPSQVATPRSITTPTDPSSRYRTIQQFFNQKRAMKTLDLVVLRVIFACSDSSNLSLEDSVESLQLANEIIGAIDIEEKGHWLRDNGPKIRKLYEKVLRVGLARELQSLAFEVIFSLVKVETLPPQLSKRFQRLMRAEEPSLPPEMADRLLSHWAITYFTPRMEEAFVSEVMGSVLSTAVQPVTPSYEILRMLQAAGLMVSALTAAVNQSPQLRSAILLTLSANAFHRLLKDLLALTPPIAREAENCSEHCVCPVALARTQRRLRLDICSLFLRTGLLASSDQAGMDPTLAVSLLEKQVEFATAIPACRFARRNIQRNVTLSLVEQSSTPSEFGASSDWRGRLAADLHREAQNHSDSIIRAVGEVCRDLEDRCMVVERPLKDEQARSKEFETQLTLATTKVAELESQAEERTLFLNGLDAEKSSLESQVRAGEARSRHLAERLEEMESKLREDLAEAERSTATAREEATDQELKHLAIVNAKEDVIAGQDERILHLEQTSKSIREELTATREASLAAQKRVKELEEEVVESARALELDRASNMQKDTDITSLRGLEVELRAKLEAADIAYRQQVTRIDSLQTELQDARVSSEENLEKLKQLHALDRESAATEVSRLIQDHEDETARLRDDLHNVVDTASIEVSEKDSTISELKRKIEKLLRDRKEKAREFAEAQDLSTKLMAVMGLKSEQASAVAHHSAKASSNDIYVDSPDGHQASRTQSTTASAQSFESSTSSKSGPTPKRTRPRRTTKTSSLQQTKIDLGAKTVKTAHDTTYQPSRQPLKDVGMGVPNRSPVRAARHGFGKPQLEGDRGWIGGEDRADEVMELGDLSFGGSDVFPSTEKEPSSARDEHGNSHLYEESTTDF